MKLGRELSNSLEWYRATTGLKPLVIVMSTVFLDELIKELDSMIGYRHDKSLVTRFQGVECIESIDFRESFKII